MRDEKQQDQHLITPVWHQGYLYDKASLLEALPEAPVVMADNFTQQLIIHLKKKGRHLKLTALDELYACPIDLVFPQQGVLCLADGHIYERAAIKDWLVKNNKSPINRDALLSHHFIVHPIYHTLRVAIEAAKKQGQETVDILTILQDYQQYAPEWVDIYRTKCMDRLGKILAGGFALLLTLRFSPLLWHYLNSLAYSLPVIIGASALSLTVVGLAQWATFSHILPRMMSEGPIKEGDNQGLILYVSLMVSIIIAYDMGCFLQMMSAQNGLDSVNIQKLVDYVVSAFVALPVYLMTTHMSAVTLNRENKLMSIIHYIASLFDPSTARNHGKLFAQIILEGTISLSLMTSVLALIVASTLVQLSIPGVGFAASVTSIATLPFIMLAAINMTHDMHEQLFNHAQASPRLTHSQKLGAFTIALLRVGAAMATFTCLQVNGFYYALGEAIKVYAGYNFNSVITPVAAQNYHPVAHEKANWRAPFAFFKPQTSTQPQPVAEHTAALAL